MITFSPGAVFELDGSVKDLWRLNLVVGLFIPRSRADCSENISTYYVKIVPWSVRPCVEIIHEHGLSILYHLQNCRPCTLLDISH